MISDTASFFYSNFRVFWCKTKQEYVSGCSDTSVHKCLFVAHNKQLSRLNNHIQDQPNNIIQVAKNINRSTDQSELYSHLTR